MVTSAPVVLVPYQQPATNSDFRISELTTDLACPFPPVNCGLTQQSRFFARGITRRRDEASTLKSEPVKHVLRSRVSDLIKRNLKNAHTLEQLRSSPLELKNGLTRLRVFSQEKTVFDGPQFLMDAPSDRYNNAVPVDASLSISGLPLIAQPRPLL